MRRRLILFSEGDVRFRPELLVLAVTNRQADALRARAEAERVIGMGINRKPVLAVNGPPHGDEPREQVLLLQVAHLRHGLAFGAHDRKEHVAVDILHLLFATELRFVNRQ